MKVCFWVFFTLLACLLGTSCNQKQGPAGIQGPPGENGATGQPGASPVITTYPAPLAECPNGGVVIQVIQPSGDIFGRGSSEPITSIVCNGQQGAIGPQGVSGVNATPVTTVEFCPGQGNTTYGHFPEYGLCIANTLYGVYWNGTDAFLAQIVPGEYQSTSTGLKCTFKVGTQCSIQ